MRKGSYNTQRVIESIGLQLKEAGSGVMIYYKRLPSSKAKDCKLLPVTWESALEIWKSLLVVTGVLYPGFNNGGVLTELSGAWFSNRADFSDESAVQKWPLLIFPLCFFSVKFIFNYLWMLSSSYHVNTNISNNHWYPCIQKDWPGLRIYFKDFLFFLSLFFFS